MTKCRKSYSIDDNVVATISRISSQRGVTDSEMVNKFLTSGISRNEELTSAERYHYQRTFINLALDNVLRLFGIFDYRGGLQDKFRCLLYMSQGNLRGKNREYRNGIIETSMFEILEEVRNLDNNIWKELVTHMNYFGKIRLRYLSLYPLSKRISSETTNGGDTITNNNTSIDSILKRKELRKEKNHSHSHDGNTVTEIKEPESSNLSDKEYIRETRKEKK